MARTRPHQVNFPGLAAQPCRILLDRFRANKSMQGLLQRGRYSFRRQVCPAGQILIAQGHIPESPAAVRGQPLFCLTPQSPRSLGEAAQILRQQGLDPCPYPTHQHGRCAPAGDGNLDRRAINHGWRDKPTMFRIIHHICGHAHFFCIPVDLMIERGVTGGCKDQPHRP